MTGQDERLWTAREARAAFADASEIALEAICPPGRALLVVAPHPDDESLGCGGLIARAADAGVEVVVAALTDGAASHPGSAAWPAERLRGQRRAELCAAVTCLAPAARVEAFEAPDGRLEAWEAQAQAWLAGLAGDGGFATVATSWNGDPHPDHKAAFRIAARQAVLWGAALFAYPVWGLILEDEADAGARAPCVKFDVAAVLARKRAAIAAHRSQTTGLIEDDPQGFRLTAADIDRHLIPYEVFLRPALR